MHFHKGSTVNKKYLEELFEKAWDLGYPRGVFYRKSELTDEIKVEDMTDYELNYIFQ